MDSQQPNNGFGPLSTPRGSGAVFGTFLVVAVSGAVHIVNAIAFSSIKESKDEILFLFFWAALLTLSLVLSELVRRVCLVNEERRHRHTRYEGSWKKLLNSTFTFRYGHSILVVGVVFFLTVSSFVLYYTLYEDCKTFCRSEYWILFSLNCFLAPQLSFLVGLREPSSAEVSQINERENKNVADGLQYCSLKLLFRLLEGGASKTCWQYRAIDFQVRYYPEKALHIDSKKLLHRQWN